MLIPGLFTCCDGKDGDEREKKEWKLEALIASDTAWVCSVIFPHIPQPDAAAIRD